MIQIKTKLIHHFKSFYNNFIRIAETSKSRIFLYLFSFFESIIIPIPTDPLMIACILAKPKKWLKICFYTSIFSVFGGICGWFIGFIVGDQIIDIIKILPEFLKTENLVSKFDKVSAKFNELGIILVLIGAFTPLPFKVIAVSSGLFGYGLLNFVFFSLIGRSLRFFIIGSMTRHRKDYKKVIFLLSIFLFFILFSYIILNY